MATCAECKSWVLFRKSQCDLGDIGTCDIQASVHSGGLVLVRAHHCCSDFAAKEKTPTVAVTGKNEIRDTELLAKLWGMRADLKAAKTDLALPRLHPAGLRINAALAASEYLIQRLSGYPTPFEGEEP